VLSRRSEASGSRAGLRPPRSRPEPARVVAPLVWPAVSSACVRRRAIRTAAVGGGGGSEALELVPAEAPIASDVRRAPWRICPAYTRPPVCRPQARDAAPCGSSFDRERQAGERRVTAERVRHELHGTRSKARAWLYSPLRRFQPQPPPGRESVSSLHGTKASRLQGAASSELIQPGSG